MKQNISAELNVQPSANIIVWRKNIPLSFKQRILHPNTGVIYIATQNHQSSGGIENDIANNLLVLDPDKKDLANISGTTSNVQEQLNSSHPALTLNVNVNGLTLDVPNQKIGLNLADSTSAGALRPLPAVNPVNYYLRGDNTWQTFPSGTAFITSVANTNTIGLTVTAFNLTADVLHQNTDSITISDNASGLKADIKVQNSPEVNLSIPDASGIKALLATTTVTAGSYGDSTHAGAFIVDTKGRLTAASNVAIAFPADYISSIANTATINLTNTAGTLTGDFTSMNISQFTNDSNYLINTRQLTINGSAQDLSANRTWAITSTGTANRIVVTGGSGLTPTIDIGTDVVTLTGSQALSNKTGLISQWSNDNNYITLASLSAVSPITYNTGTGVISTSMSTNKLIGRGTAGTGVAEEITLGSGLSMSGTTLNVSGFSSSTLTDTHIFVGNSSNVATDVVVSGDATLANTGALTLATVNANVGTYGSATKSVTITATAKGLITAISEQTVTPAFSSITGTPTTLAGYGITDAISSTLTNAHLLVGNASNIAVDVAASGDVTLANTGAFTIANLAVTTAKINTNAVTYAKMQAVSGTSLLLGSSSTTTPVQEITIGTGLSLSGTTLTASGSGGTVTSVTSADGNATVANTTTTPVITIVSAPILQTARTIGGVSFNGSVNIVPQTIQSVNEATDTTCFPLFISASGSQSLQPLNNAGFIYNSNTNALTATTFVGALTGNASTASSAAKWTTARNLAGNSVDGSANVAFANTFIVQGTADSGLSAAQFLGALGTGIVKNTTTTGVLSIAVSGDFPTLNQNTTGTGNVSGGTVGAIPYQSAANTTTVLAATTTANQMLLSGASAAPTWSTMVMPTTSAASTILASATANTITASANPLVSQSTNSNSGFEARNTNTSTAATALIRATNSGATGINIETLSTGFTTSGLRVANSTWVYNNNASAPLNIGTSTSQAMILFTGGTAASNEGARIDTSQRFAIKVGGISGTSTGKVGGIIYNSTTQTGNTAATETTLFTQSVTGATLNTNLDSLRWEAWGTFAGTASVNKRIIIYWGTTTLFDSSTLAITSASDWHASGTIIRTGAATQKALTKLESSSSVLVDTVKFTSPTETLASASTFKITGNGTNANDVVIEVTKIEWLSAA